MKNIHSHFSFSLPSQSLLEVSAHHMDHGMLKSSKCLNNCSVSERIVPIAALTDVTVQKYGHQFFQYVRQKRTGIWKVFNVMPKFFIQAVFCSCSLKAAAPEGQ